MGQTVMTKALPRDVAERHHFAGSRALARHRSGISTSHHPSFVQLYYALEARRASDSQSRSLVVQFVSPSGGAGVSTVASGYARVAAAGSSAPVLFVDASCRIGRYDTAGSDTPTLIDAYQAKFEIEDAIVLARNADNLFWSRLCSYPDALLELGRERLVGLIQLMAIKYPIVVLDSASVQCPEAVALSRLCDGTLLVLEAGVTSQQQVDAACKRIKQAGGLPVGVVLNREKRAFGQKRVRFG